MSFHHSHRCPWRFLLGHWRNPIWWANVIKETESPCRVLKMKWASLLYFFLSLIVGGCGSRWKMYVSSNQSVAEEKSRGWRKWGFSAGLFWKPPILGFCWKWGLGVVEWTVVQERSLSNGLMWLPLMNSVNWNTRKHLIGQSYYCHSSLNITVEIFSS